MGARAGFGVRVGLLVARAVSECARLQAAELTDLAGYQFRVRRLGLSGRPYMPRSPNKEKAHALILNILLPNLRTVQITWFGMVLKVLMPF